MGFVARCCLLGPLRLMARVRSAAVAADFGSGPTWIQMHVLIILSVLPFGVLVLLAFGCSRSQVKKVGKTPTGRNNANSPFFGLKMPKELPTSDNDLPQSEARVYMPPFCSIWRSDVAGAWAPQRSFLNVSLHFGNLRCFRSLPIGRRS